MIQLQLLVIYSLLAALSKYGSVTEVCAFSLCLTKELTTNKTETMMMMMMMMMKVDHRQYC